VLVTMHAQSIYSMTIVY